MPPVLFVLLPPSEGKAEGGGDPPWAVDAGRFASLAPQRLRVARALQRARGGDERTVGARGDLLARAQAANRGLVGAPTLPSWQRFTGVVWDHLGPADLAARARRRAEAGVVVVSAVTGLSAWDDPVPDFRLKLSVGLEPIGRLAAFWREPLSAVLNDHLAGHTVVDLLPNEHRAAWTPTPDRYELVRPDLRTPDGKPAGHNGKAAKGRLARALLGAGDLDAGLAAFDPGDLVLDVATPAAP